VIEKKCWFNTEPRYEGEGDAEFQDPPGIIHGHSQVISNEYGQLEIIMDVDRINCDEQLSEGISEFCFCKTPKQIQREPKNKVLTYGTLGKGSSRKVLTNIPNPCTNLIIKTNSGEVVVESPTFYSISGSPFSSNAEHSVVKFHPKRIEYVEDNKNKPKYWVLPLSNFITTFWPWGQHLIDHPLRTRQPQLPVLPDSKIEKKTEETLRALQNLMIYFEFNNHPAFIEPLPNYMENKQQLENGSIRNAITAVMIGEMGRKSSVSYSRLLEWIPLDLLPILSFASGATVYSPWIEIRDSSGRIKKRIHLSISKQTYSKGHQGISQNIQRGTDLLLRTSQNSEYFKTSFLNVFLKHTVQGSLYNKSIEDKLVHFVRALECLCNEFDSFAVFSPESELQDQDQQKLKTVIKEAKKRVKDMKQTAIENNDQQASDYLERVLMRLGQSVKYNSGFGKAIKSLLETFKLQDSLALGDFIRNSSQYDADNFGDLIAKYRGLIVHSGYIDFMSGKYDLHSVWQLVMHIQDILARIALRLLGYSGQYEPTMTPFGDARDLDWVTSETKPKELGYGE